MKKPIISDSSYGMMAAAVASQMILFEHGLIELKPLSRKEAEQRYPKHEPAPEIGRKYRRGKKHRMKGLRP